MPISALPEHLKDIDYWKDNNTDNASWLMRQKKKIQYLLAAGPRVPGGFWKWREIPKTLIVVGGKKSNHFRVEDSRGMNVGIYEPGVYINAKFPFPVSTSTMPGVDIYLEGYLSRIQPWCRWHFAIQWPLYIQVHFIYRQKNVVKFPTYQSDFGITKMITFGLGFKRGGDRVYWMTANAGGNFE